MKGKINMKKILLSLLLVLLLANVAIAQESETTVIVPGVLKRDIQLAGQNADGNYPTNPVIPGVSSTTGLPIKDQKYVPILLTIDNNWAAWPQWGLVEADIMYEMPISGGGWTRLVALYSDQYPEEAGPSRSARVMHADLREEWDALLLHYGEQTDEGSNFLDAIRGYGASKKGLEIDGIGNRYSQYFPRVRYHKAPHNVTVFVQQLRDFIIATGYEFPQRPFKFSDEIGYAGPSAVKIDLMHKDNKDEATTFFYDANRNSYVRYNSKGIYTDLLKPDTALYYSNVIVQRSRLTFNSSSSMPLLPDVVGSGAADIFIGGHYIEGAWTRSSAQSRTVFLDQSGNEIALQRGKTWIVICGDDTKISYQTQLDEDTATYYAEMGTLPKYKPLRIGDNNDDVKKMKQRLAELGFIKGNTFNNQYQENTAESVMAFEEANALPVDGIADSLMLHKLYEGTEPEPVSTKINEDEPVVQPVAETEEDSEADESVNPTENAEASLVIENSPAIPSETLEEAAEEASPDETPLPEETMKGEEQTAEVVEEAKGTPVDNSGLIVADDKVFATVTTPNKGTVNLRVGESRNARLISRIGNGSTVQVLFRGEEWTKVLYEEQEGYVMSAFLDFSTP